MYSIDLVKSEIEKVIPKNYRLSNLLDSHIPNRIANKLNRIAKKLNNDEKVVLFAFASISLEFKGHYGILVVTNERLIHFSEITKEINFEDILKISKGREKIDLHNSFREKITIRPLSIDNVELLNLLNILHKNHIEQIKEKNRELYSEIQLRQKKYKVKDNLFTLLGLVSLIIMIVCSYNLFL